jgi:hypothetical protein
LAQPKTVVLTEKQIHKLWIVFVEIEIEYLNSNKIDKNEKNIYYAWCFDLYSSKSNRKEIIAEVVWEFNW